MATEMDEFRIREEKIAFVYSDDCGFKTKYIIQERFKRGWLGSLIFGNLYYWEDMKVGYYEIPIFYNKKRAEKYIKNLKKVIESDLEVE